MASSEMRDATMFCEDATMIMMMMMTYVTCELEVGPAAMCVFYFIRNADHYAAAVCWRCRRSMALSLFGFRSTTRFYPSTV